MNCIKNERIKNEIIKNECIKNERIKNELIKKRTDPNNSNLSRLRVSTKMCFMGQCHEKLWHFIK